jgi:hypothetical protein
MKEEKGRRSTVDVRLVSLTPQRIITIGRE